MKITGRPASELDRLAWAVPIHKCWFPSTPTPVGSPIPCSYTNQDGIGHHDRQRRGPTLDAAVKLCGDGWCIELNAYIDCNDYYSIEGKKDGVGCYDIV